MEPEEEYLPSTSRPVDIKTFKYVQDYLHCPKEDRVYAVSKIFLDNLCPLDGGLEFHSALTKLPVLMPCQLACPPALAKKTRNADMIMLVPSVFMC